MKKLLVLLVVGGAIAIGYSSYQFFTSDVKAFHYLTAKVQRGELLVSVTATGTLEPEELVDVGAQVVGRVKELGINTRSSADGRNVSKHVDYGSLVEQDQVLAIIDDSVYRAQWSQAKAALLYSKANLLQLQAKLMQTEAEWLRAQKLRSNNNAISDTDFVMAQSNYEAAKANVEAGKATIEQNAATLQLAETNLGYTVIKSPVSGTIIDRRVNIGQTVVSSLNAPSLFLIAKDLSRMQVWASVNEADIGLIKVGMPVKFTVDAFPEDVFQGTVVQVRLNATMTQNVVTYTVVVTNDNSDLKLLPYLTADVKFVVKQIPNALLVPNAALRYQPSVERIATVTNSTSPVGTDTSVTASPKGKPGTVWIRRGNMVVPIAVRVGESDDIVTEIQSNQLTEGSEVVLGESQSVIAQDVTNPFAPPRRMPKQTSAASNKKKTNNVVSP